MTTDVVAFSQVTPVASDAPDVLHAVVRGSPPVRHWKDFAGWLVGRGESPALTEVATTWLVSCGSGSDHTRNAYVADLSRWFTWCDARGRHPVTARYTDADLYAAACREAGLAKATINRRLAAASSWYIYALRAEVASVNPFQGMERPKRPAVSATRSMSKRELAALLACAKIHGRAEVAERETARDAYQRSVEVGEPLTGYALAKMFGRKPNEGWGYRRIREVQEGRGTAGEAADEAKRPYALLMTMTATASRIGAVLAADVTDLGSDDGYRTLDLTVKGDERKRFVMPAPAIAAVEGYLDGRTRGPLFMTATGGRLSQQYVSRLIKRLAEQAGIPQAAELSTHSMRHTVATVLLRSGHQIYVVKGLLGHADIRTTELYNHALQGLDDSPAGSMTDLIIAEMRLLEAENE